MAAEDRAFGQSRAVIGCRAVTATGARSVSIEINISDIFVTVWGSQNTTYTDDDHTS